LALGLCYAKRAGAFTIESYATEGCHERVTADAWRRTVESLPTVTQDLPSSGDDDALIDDLPFEIADSLRSIGPTALLLGVRDNDVKEVGANDLESLGPIASDPQLQAEHCLRGPEDDEPGGSRQAVLACRSFIRQRLLSALDGLAADGSPDPTKRATLRVALAIRGKVAVSLPLFFLQAGRGLHALQDSFTHTFRDPEHPGHIRVALNFVDYTGKSLDEAIDGPEHASDLDRCDDPDELRTERRQLATEASAVALTALLEPSSSRADKEQAIERMLDDYVAFDDSADCSAENHWCDAPENQYGSPKLSCSLGAGVPARHGPWALLTLVGLVAARRRRARAVLSVAAAFAALGFTGVAEAAPPSQAALADARACDTTALTPTDRAGAWFGRVAIGASYEHTALAGGAGLRYAFRQKWMVGFDAEWNPYLALKPRKFRSGSANAYFSIIRRSQLQRASMNLRSTASLGVALLLSDLVGADRFSVGPYFGLSLLGVEWKAARNFYVTIDPTYIAIPVPSLTGIPFMYVQYRFLVGIEFGG
jgi:MYXO-CTERM domain-containing protein